MFEQLRLTEVLVQYKQNFVSKLWGEEKYKWEAVKWFQDNWDVNAPDFAEMLNRSLDKTYNLLASANNFPKGMIVGFAKSAPEEVRAMFLSLYDESKDVCTCVCRRRQFALWRIAYEKMAICDFKHRHAVHRAGWRRVFCLCGNGDHQRQLRR